MAAFLYSIYNLEMAAAQQVPSSPPSPVPSDSSPLYPYHNHYLYQHWLHLKQLLLQQQLQQHHQQQEQEQHNTQTTTQECDPTSSCSSTTQTNSEPNGKNVINGGITFSNGRVKIGG
jgi:hypothetical protein